MYVYSTFFIDFSAMTREVDLKYIAVNFHDILSWKSSPITD